MLLLAAEPLSPLTTTPTLAVWPHHRSGDLGILNSAHGVLVGMVIKLSGQIMHTNPDESCMWAWTTPEEGCLFWLLP